MEANTDESQEALPQNNRNANIMHVGYTILDAEVESIIDENWCLLENQSTCNAFINGKYLSNIRDTTDGKYILVHCNAGVT